MNEEKIVMPEDGASAPSPEKKKSKKKWLIGLLILLLLIGGTLLTLYKLGYFDKPNEDGIMIAAGLQEGTPASGEAGEPGANGTEAMDISLNGKPVFADGESTGDLYIVNPETNLLYMNVEITLDDTGEVIYDSGGIPPNHYIDNDKLAVVLTKGEYAATARVTLYDPDNQDAVYNSANFHLVITIEN